MHGNDNAENISEVNFTNQISYVVILSVSGLRLFSGKMAIWASSTYMD